MTAAGRVRRTQRLIGVAAISEAILWGAALTLAVLALLAFEALLSKRPSHASESGGWIAIILGLLVAAASIWRSRHFSSTRRVALWIEEKIPALQYSLVTAMEHGTSPFAAGMESIVARQDIAGVTSSALRRRLLPAAGTAIATALLLYVSPSAAFGGAGIFPRLGRSASSVATPGGSRIENIEARVTPPAYAGGGTRTLDDPSSITALAGSRVVVTGSGDATGVTARVAGAAVSVSGAGDGWIASLVMPSRPAALTLGDREHERIVVLDARMDNPPKIALISPPRDTTLRAAQLIIRLGASATDDIGLGAGYFEFLVTTGSGEVFAARTVTTPVSDFRGSRTGSLSATFDLASLRLDQGDVVSIRAIAQDGNTLSGPGLATSDTRTFRIARAEEYDSVAIDAAAPLPVDSSAISQRMLIMMTEKLVREKKTIGRAGLVKRSGEIGDLEDRIRKRVEEILYEHGGEEEDESAPPDPNATLEGEESGQARAVDNPDLTEAFNALWAAVRSLQIAEPDSALPPMRVALKALDRARLANRLYLRGTPPKVIVDIARVRMTGKDKGSASIRTPRNATDSARAALERRFDEAVELLASRPEDAVRTFTLLQVDALSFSPRLATSLGEAIEAFRKGRDATLPVLRSRRALFGDPASAPGLPVWSW